MSQIYTKENPFYASILERYSLCKPGSHKETMHLTLDLSGSGIRYEVGDSVAILPSNDSLLVTWIIERLNASPSDEVADEKTGQKFSLRAFLEQKVNISAASPRFLSTLFELEPSKEKKEFLRSLLEDKEQMKGYLAGNDLVDLLEEFPDAEFGFEQFCSHLRPLMPRFYSIASSMKQAGERMDLTIALKNWDCNGKTKAGVCTRFLCSALPLHQPVVPLYIHPHRGFTLPEDPLADIIMIGPGTGIAPFRAFMQEREKMEHSGKSWLFFGECHRDKNFFYEEYWSRLTQEGKLKLELAFSRDQRDKIYVQHRMLENGAALYRWLSEGAYLYVCGDASAMAKDVDQALHDIIAIHAPCTEEQAKEFVKKLKKEKRYLRDVY